MRPVRRLRAVVRGRIEVPALANHRIQQQKVADSATPANRGLTPFHDRVLRERGQTPIMQTRMATTTAKPRISPTSQIMIGLFLGLVIGYVISITDPTWAKILRPFSQIFIRMI